jgi:hypothetical protein
MQETEIEGQQNQDKNVEAEPHPEGIHRGISNKELKKQLCCGDFPSFVHLEDDFEDDFVGVPVGEEIHPTGDGKGDHHARLTADGSAHGDKKKGERGEKKGNFEHVHSFTSVRLVIAAGKRKDLLPAALMNAVDKGLAWFDLRHNSRVRVTKPPY